jgi:hypothetical protein
VTLVSLLAGCSGPPRTTQLREVPLPPGGLAMPVDGFAMTMLPLEAVEAMEIEYRASGQISLSYGTTGSPEGMQSLDQPWRHAMLPPGTGRVRMDFLTTRNWSPYQRVYLRLAGTGQLVITRAWILPLPGSAEELRETANRAWRSVPISLGHYSVNLLDPPFWKVSDMSLLVPRLGWLFLALAAGGTAASSLWRRRFRPGPALALAAVAVMGLGDGLFWRRMLPPLDLRLPASPEERIRDGYRFDPEVGPLSALARAHLKPDDRVGVMVPPGAWFLWEPLCFNLAPRRCVNLEAGAAEHAGLQGVDRLALRDVDAIVTLHSPEPLPPGFTPVAALNPSAQVARRP